MKILITTDWYRPVINGVVTSVLNLTEQLEKHGHEVKVLTLSRNCHSYKEENVIYAGSVGMGKIYPQARVKIPVVILLGKPCSIALYSLGLTTAFRMIFSV